MKALNNIAKAMGSAIGTFQRSRVLSRFGGRKPQFFGSLADEERYRTRTGYEEQAAKRAIQSSWVFSAVSLKAREVAAAKFQVMKHQGHGTNKEPEHDIDHPLELLLRRPNEYLGGAFLWEYTDWWLELDGNAYWWLGFNEVGHLSEIWPLPSCDIEIVPGDKDKLIKGYEYTVNGSIYTIPSEYIVHMMYPNMFDIFRGLSRLRAAMMGVDTDLAMSRWNARFFGPDNVMPSAIINLSSGDPNQPVEKGDIEALKDDLKAGYSAFKRKTAVTGAYKMEVEQLGWNPKDLDFLAGREFTKDEIFLIFGIPGALFDKNATYSNSENAERIFNSKTLWPLLRLLSEQITAQLVAPIYGPSYSAAWEEIRMDSREIQISEISASEAYMTIDEVRSKYYKLPELPDGRGGWTAREQPEAASDEPAGGQVIEGDWEESPPKEGGERPKQAALPDSSGKEAEEEMRLWKRKALNAIRRDRAVPTSFVSDSIPPALKSRLVASLEVLRAKQDQGLIGDAELQSGIRAVFSEFAAAARNPGPVSPHQGAVLDIKKWERRAIARLADTGRPLLLYSTQEIPPNVVQWLRTELSVCPPSPEAVRSVFGEVLDFFYPLRSGA